MSIISPEAEETYSENWYSFNSDFNHPKGQIIFETHFGMKIPFRDICFHINMKYQNNLFIIFPSHFKSNQYIGDIVYKYISPLNMAYLI